MPESAGETSFKSQPIPDFSNVVDHSTNHPERNGNRRSFPDGKGEALTTHLQNDQVNFVFLCLGRTLL